MYFSHTFKELNLYLFNKHLKFNDFEGDCKPCHENDEYCVVSASFSVKLPPRD